MKMVEIRKLTTEDLNKKLDEIKKELFNLKFAASTGNLEKPHRVKELRHTVAKIKGKQETRISRKSCKYCLW